MSSSEQRPPLSCKFIGAVEDEWQLYSDRSQDYTLGLPIGFGASSTVYAAKFHPPPDEHGNSCSPIPVALKVVNLEKLPSHSLALLQRETTLMSLSKHPNVLRVRGAWTDGHKLYIAMRLMNKGSAADIMRYGWPGGMEEEVIRCILYQGLQGLNYLHVNGFIHRDIKAANMLIDDDGTVLLGDLGVAADLADDNSHSATSHNRAHTITAASAVSEFHHRPSLTRDNSSSSIPRRVVVLDKPGHHSVGHSVVSRPALIKRKSFVGTPCWMAPEVIQSHQYDTAADIWSFGITALELSLGRPPRSRESPQRVLLRTIQDDPPTLDREGGTFKYSRAFKEMIDRCLVKDPAKRPSADELLQMPFFKNVKKKGYLVNAILKDLPPLTSRQERRLVQNTLVHPSVASWDFTPTPTLHARTNSKKSMDSPSLSLLETEPGFDFDSPPPTISRPGSWGFPGHHPDPGTDVIRALTGIIDEGRKPSSVTSSESDEQSDTNSTPPTSENEPVDGVSLKTSSAVATDGGTPPSGRSFQAPTSMTAPVPVPSSSSRNKEGQFLSGITANLSSPSQGPNLWTRLKNKTKNLRNDDSESFVDSKLSLVRTFSRRRS